MGIILGDVMPEKVQEFLGGESKSEGLHNVESGLAERGRQ